MLLWFIGRSFPWANIFMMPKEFARRTRTRFPVIVHRNLSYHKIWELSGSVHFNANSYIVSEVKGLVKRSRPMTLPILPITSSDQRHEVDTQIWKSCPNWYEWMRSRLKSIPFSHFRMTTEWPIRDHNPPLSTLLQSQLSENSRMNPFARLWIISSPFNPQYF